MVQELKEYRLLMVSSSGGVLLDLLALKPWWQQHQLTWALVEAEDTRTLFENNPVVYWLQECKANTTWRLLRYVVLAIRIIRKHKPHFVISSGTGVAIPFFVAAKLLKVNSFWLETLNIMDRPGTASRICASLASEVLVQRPSLKKVYPNAVVIGELY